MMINHIADNDWRDNDLLMVTTATMIISEIQDTTVTKTTLSIRTLNIYQPSRIH